MQTTGLLNSTALDKIAIESFIFDEPNGAESQMAIEALGEKIKEKTAQWSAKILHLVKEKGSKIFNLVEELFTKVKSKIKILSERSWKTAKAHPYSTVIAVLAAITAVGGIMVFCGSNLPLSGSSKETISAFATKLKTMTNSIKLPFGKIEATLSSDGTVKLAPKIDFTKIESYTSMDQIDNWEKVQSTTIGNQIDHARSMMKKGFTFFYNGVIKVASLHVKAVTEVSGKIVDIATGNDLSKQTKIMDAARIRAVAAGSNVTVNHVETMGNGVSNTLRSFRKHRLMTNIIEVPISGLFGFIYGLILGVVVNGIRFVNRTIKNLLSSSEEKPTVS